MTKRPATQDPRKPDEGRNFVKEGLTLNLARPGVAENAEPTPPEYNPEKPDASGSSSERLLRVHRAARKLEEMIQQLENDGTLPPRRYSGGKNVDYKQLLDQSAALQINIHRMIAKSSLTLRVEINTLAKYLGVPSETLQVYVDENYPGRHRFRMAQYVVQH